MITRIAPTPSGYLHEGNLFNFLLNWLWARSRNGQVLLRIDDLDAARKRQEYVEDIFRMLDWLGLDWDMGPSGPDDFEKNWSQTQRQPLYEKTLQHLQEQELLFACSCTRSQLPAGAPYPGTCAGRQLPLQVTPFAWRIKLQGRPDTRWEDVEMHQAVVDLAVQTGAFIVRRSDGLPAYQVCSLTDDRYFGVTHIARGADLLESTAMQLYLDQLLSPALFNQCRFWHHPLLKTASGDKISKSAGARGQSLRETGSRDNIIRAFSRWMGWEDAGTLPELTVSMIHHLDHLQNNTNRE